MSVLAYLLAATIGVSLGLLGGGGSILAVPVLAYVVGLPAKEAIATSLIVVGATSLVGMVRHWLAHNIDMRAALVFGVISMAAAFAGGWLAVFFAGWLQLTIFGVVMIAAAVSMLRGRNEEDDPRRGPVSPYAVGLAAAGTGVLTGIVGVGGGFLIVPALVTFAHLPMKRAVGTSLLVIAMNSAAAFAAYIGKVPIALGPTALFTLAAFAGVAVGAALVPHVSTASLRKGFAVFLICVASFVLYRNGSHVIAAATETAQLRRGK